jgi:hypothetical protein
MTKKQKTPLSKRAATALASMRDERRRHLEPAFKLVEAPGYPKTDAVSCCVLFSWRASPDWGGPRRQINAVVGRESRRSNAPKGGRCRPLREAPDLSSSARPQGQLNSRTRERVSTLRCLPRYLPIFLSRPGKMHFEAFPERQELRERTRTYEFLLSPRRQPRSPIDVHH